MIEFPQEHRWDSEVQGIGFDAVRGEQRIYCVITRRALHRAFDVFENAELEQAFLTNRSRIERLARKKIDFQLFDQNGRVLITGDEVVLL